MFFIWFFTHVVGGVFNLRVFDFKYLSQDFYYSKIHEGAPE
jgi:hypothetical protein